MGAGKRGRSEGQLAQRLDRQTHTLTRIPTAPSPAQPPPRERPAPGKTSLPDTRWSQKKACAACAPRRMANATRRPAPEPATLAPPSCTCAGGTTLTYWRCQVGW